MITPGQKVGKILTGDREKYWFQWELTYLNLMDKLERKIKHPTEQQIEQELSKMFKKVRKYFTDREWQVIEPFTIKSTKKWFKND